MGIDCYVEEPFQFMDATPFLPVGAANSTRNGVEATVSWSEVSADSSSATIMLATLAVTIVIVLGVAIRFASVNQESREIDYTTDDDERVDRFAQMMDEDDD